MDSVQTSQEETLLEEGCNHFFSSSLYILKNAIMIYLPLLAQTQALLYVSGV